MIANNSQVNTRNIGQSSDSPNGALQCITDKTPCCSQSPRLGEWYLPNGALVQGTTSTTAFYRNREDSGEVSLNRPSDVMSPTGQFCCEVPDATDTNQTLCVNIGETQYKNAFSAVNETLVLLYEVGTSKNVVLRLVGLPISTRNSVYDYVDVLITIKCSIQFMNTTVNIS